MATATVTDTRYITLDNLNHFLSNLQLYFKTSDKMFGGIKIGYTSDDKNRAVQLDKDGKAYIELPELKIPVATDNKVGGIKIGYNGNQPDDRGNRPVLLDDHDRAYVNVNIPAATASTFGCIKIGYNGGKDDNSYAKNGYKRFPLLLNDGQAHVDIKYAYSYKGTSGENNNGGLITYAELQTLYGHIDFFKSIIGYDNGKVEWNEANATLKKVNATSSEGKPYYYFTIPLANDKTALGGIGGIKLGYTQNNRNYPVKLDDQGRAFVNVPWEAGQGGGETVVVTPDMTEIEHAKLLEMVNGDEDVNGVVQSLVPGAKYRITDFVTTIPSDYKQTHNTIPNQFDILGRNSENNKITSAGHSFDIIVTALTEHSLSEDAKACMHKGDDYFDNSNLDAWELKYCINNDKTRFDWADDVNGKGVIYYMKDEHGNECPYDFKNILYYGHYTFDVAEYDTNGKYFVPTVSTKVATEDASISTATRNAVALNNSISKYSYLTYYDGNKKNEPQTLNNIVCIFNKEYLTNFANLGDLIISGNVFGLNDNNIILYMPRRNKFEENCFNIFIVGSGCSSNEFGKDCNNIYISYDYPDDEYYRDNGYDQETEMTPIIRIQTDSSLLGTGEATYNKFGSNCNNFIANDYFSHNTFKNNCNHFEFGENCRYNSVGANCSYFRFGKYFIKNTIADNNYKTSNFINQLNNESINDHTTRAKSFAGLYTRLDANGVYRQAYKRIPYVCNCEFGPNSNIPIIIDHYNLLFGLAYDKESIWDENKSVFNPERDVLDIIGENYIFKNYKFINIQPQPDYINGNGNGLAPIIIDVLKNTEVSIKNAIVDISSGNTHINDDNYKDLDHDIHEYAAMDICNRDYVTTVAGTTYDEDNKDQQYISNNIYKLIDDLKQNSGTILPPSDDSGDNSEETVAIKELRDKCTQLERSCVVAFNDIIKTLSEKYDNKDEVLSDLAGALGNGWNTGTYEHYFDSPGGDKLIPIFEKNFGYGQLDEDGNPQGDMPGLHASFMTEEEFEKCKSETYPISIYNKCAALERCCVATIYFILGRLSDTVNNPLGNNRINPPINFSWNRFKDSGNEFLEEASGIGPNGQIQYNADIYDWNALVPIFASNRGWGREDGGTGALEAYGYIDGYGDRRNPDNKDDNRNYYVFYPDPNFVDYNGNDYGKDESGVNP